MPSKVITCQQCGNDFNTFPSRATRFCSRACQSAAQVKREVHNCEHCQRVITGKPSDFSKGKRFCSIACQSQARMATPVLDRLFARREINPETGCWLWVGQPATRTGYCRIGWNGAHVLVHRLAAHLFLGFDLESPQVVCHRCDTRNCFNPDHLFVGTQEDNIADMVQKGRQNTARGSSSVNSKLTAADVVEIRRLCQSRVPFKEIAARFGITTHNVTAINTGRTWRHLP